MKYLIRAVKYFVRMTVILALVLFVLAELKFINSELSTMFVNGYDSLWQIGLILLAFSALYPSFGYTKREVAVKGDPAGNRSGIIETMDSHGYRLAKEIEGNMVFRKRAPLARVLKLFEDSITFSPVLGGYIIEGLTKDTVRIASSVEYKFRSPEEGA